MTQLWRLMLPYQTSVYQDNSGRQAEATRIEIRKLAARKRSSASGHSLERTSLLMAASIATTASSGAPILFIAQF